MFQVVEMLLICVLYALLELCIMTPLKTRDGLKNPRLGMEILLLIMEGDGSKVNLTSLGLPVCF